MVMFLLGIALGAFVTLFVVVAVKTKERNAVYDAEQKPIHGQNWAAGATERPPAYGAGISGYR